MAPSPCRGGGRRARGWLRPLVCGLALTAGTCGPGGAVGLGGDDARAFDVAFTLVVVGLDAGDAATRIPPPTWRERVARVLRDVAANHSSGGGTLVTAEEPQSAWEGEVRVADASAMREDAGAETRVHIEVTDVAEHVLVPFATTLRVRAMSTLVAVDETMSVYVDQLTHGWLAARCAPSRWSPTLEGAYEEHEAGDTKKAVEQLTDMLACRSLQARGDEASASFDADVYSMLGYVIREAPRPDYRLSETFYLRALQLNPLHPGALSYVGELYAKTGRGVMALSVRARLAEVACPGGRPRAQRRGGGGSVCPDLSVLDLQLDRLGVDKDEPATVLDVSAVQLPISSELLVATGVIGSITSSSPHTLFLPCDSAWRGMAGALNMTARGKDASPRELAANLVTALGRDVLARLLLRHIHRGSTLLMSDDLQGGLEVSTLGLAQERLSFFSHGVTRRILAGSRGAILLPEMMDGVTIGTNQTCVIHGISTVLQSSNGAADESAADEQFEPSAAKKIDWIRGLLSGVALAESYTAGTMLSIEWTGNHDVYQMASRDKFAACDFSGATMLGATSPVLFEVPANAAVFLACSVGSHCRDGQKLALNDNLPAGDATAPLPPPPPPTKTATSTTTTGAQATVTVSLGMPAIRGGWLLPLCATFALGIIAQHMLP